MPIKRPKLTNGEIYHITVRGVEGRPIFRDDIDRYRAIRGLYSFNDENPVEWYFRKPSENRSRNGNSEKEKDRDTLLNLLAFCFMPNHIHLLLQQEKDNGISKFMRKFGAGYAGFFNRRHERKGYLFQGRFRAVHISSINQLKIVFAYIHTNPGALFDSGWKKGKIGDVAQIIKEIENYKWSSYRDYLGHKNFPLVTGRDFLNKIMTVLEWKAFVDDLVMSKKLFREPFSEFEGL